MKKHKRIVLPNYENTDNFQPCWTCKNACGGCSWSREFKPVNGWTAEKSVIPGNRELSETYKIISCPEYVRG